MKEIFGNGGEGIKTEMVKLRQALKIATWMVTILAGIFSAVVIGEWLSYSGDQLRIMELLRKIAER